MKKLLTLFALFAFTVVFLNPVSTQAANSPNFEFNLKSYADDYAETSDGDYFVLNLKKPAKNLKFGLVLDSIKDSSELPFTIYMKLEEEYNGDTKYKTKSVTFKKLGKTEYSASYSGTIDAGRYHIRMYTEQGTKVTGNGFVYYDYK